MDALSWIFSGIGTALVVFVLGFFGAKAAQRKSKLRQVQKGGDGAMQAQSGRDTKVQR